MAQTRKTSLPTSITLKPEVKRAATERAKSLGLTFSAYVALLVALDQGVAPIVLRQQS